MAERRAALKEGYLVKKGHVRHRWKTRWFVLQESRLSYFRKKDRETHVGSIDLAGAAVSFPVEGYEKRQGVFKVCTASGRDYMLRAPTDEDRGVWTHSIGAVIRALEGMAQRESSSVAKQLSDRVNLSDVLGAMQDPDAGTTMTSCTVDEVDYNDCFSGTMVVDWIMQWNFATTREDAAALSDELLRLAHIQLLKGPTNKNGQIPSFQDDPDVFYRFSSLTRYGSQEMLLYSSSDSSSSSAGELSEGDLLDTPASKASKGKVVKEGILMKRGHLRRKWKSRKIVVKDHPPSLVYFSSTKQDQEALKVISLSGAKVMDTKEASNNQDFLSALPRKKKHVFCVQRPDGGLIVFQAEDDHEVRDWIKAINKVSTINKDI